MPINDAVAFTEKPTKSAATPSSSSTIKSGGSGSAGQLHELQNLNTGNSSATKYIENGLIKHQGQKWQQIFDFEKMLKQIRVAEKQHLRGGGCSSSKSDSGNSNGKNASASQHRSHSPPKAAGRTTRTQPKQVQRLNGVDMHYYGISPKQTAMDVIVCSVCRGIYTKMGFNNHMMLQHPTVWSSVSNKVATAVIDASTAAVVSTTAESSQENAREPTSGGAELVAASPSDMSGTISTCSNASSSSTSSHVFPATAAATATTSTPNSRHKSSKTSSTPGSSSGRSRSKSKHHSSSSASSSSTSTSAELSQTSSKSSKKSSSSGGSTSTANATPASAPTPLGSLSNLSSAKEIKTLTTTSTVPAATSVQPITLFSSSSSSNSSCSLPPTPKMLNTTVVVEPTPVSVAPLQESTFLPTSLMSLSDAKENKTTAAAMASTSAVISSTSSSSSKKKNKSPTTFLGQESVDSTSSSSSSEYDRASSSGGGTVISSKSGSTSSTAKVKSNKPNIAVTTTAEAAATVTSTIKPPQQISELDQAVSSITGGDSGEQERIKQESPIEAVIAEENIVESVDAVYQVHAPAAEGLSLAIASKKLASTVVSGTAVGSSYAPQAIAVATACNEPLQQNASEENSIFTLEDMLDSKFINDILNTAESEIHFDENDLESTTQQQTTAYMQPATKRMRYDEPITLSQQQQQQQLLPDVAVSGSEYAIFQQQQQQQYTQYEAAAPLEDIKLYNAVEHQQHQQQQQANMDVQYQQQEQHQITSIDAMQLQHLLYQQQQAYVGEQYHDSKQLIDLCGDVVEVEEKPKANYEEYGANSSCANEAAPFQICNVRSLTDDDDVIGQSTVVHSAPQYVLPEATTADEQHLIYEITGNNQVMTVMSQQRQQQVIAEFLTQAGYEHVDNVQQTIGTTTHNSDNPWDDELFDFDFSQLETVKSITNTNKYHEDFYFNVFIYAGIPRPLTINCFGLIKLPHAAATTFRKHLLTTRKANNSPITLSSSGGTCLNGVVGVGGTNSGTTAASRFSITNSGKCAAANEFSIGSITITNPPPTPNGMSQHQTSFAANAQQKPSVTGLNNCGGLAAGVQTKNKSTLVSGGSSNLAPIAVITPTTRIGARAATPHTPPPPSPQSAKTIYVSQTSTSQTQDRVRLIKRSLIAKPCDTAAAAKKSANFSPKQLADMLSLNAATVKNISKPSKLSASAAAIDNTSDNLTTSADQQNAVRFNRVNSFYERRRKLLNAANNYMRPMAASSNINTTFVTPIQEQQHQQLKQKLLKQQLMRTLSDCGLNAKRSDNSNGGSNPSNNSEIMRVFV